MERRVDRFIDNGNSCQALLWVALLSCQLRMSDVTVTICLVAAVPPSLPKTISLLMLPPPPQQPLENAYLSVGEKRSEK